MLTNGIFHKNCLYILVFYVMSWCSKMSRAGISYVQLMIENVIGLTPTVSLSCTLPTMGKLFTSHTYCCHQAV